MIFVYHLLILSVVVVWYIDVCCAQKVCFVWYAYSLCCDLTWLNDGCVYALKTSMFLLCKF